MRDRIEAGFEAWGHVVYRRAHLAIALVLAAVVGLATQLVHLELDTSTESFLHEDDPVRIAYERFRDEFGRDERILLGIEAAEIFDLAFLEKLRRLHEALEAEVPQIQEVDSLIDARDTRGEGDELVVGDLFERWPRSEAELAAIRARALANPLYRDLLISADGTFTTVMIEPDAYSSVGGDGDVLAGFDTSPADAESGRPPFISGEENQAIVDAVGAVVARHDAPEFRIYSAGSPVMTVRLMTSMLRNMRVFTSLSLLTIAVCLALLFRRAVGVVLPILVSGLSLVATLAIMAMVGIKITLPIQILPSFLLAVGVGGAVHILVIFLQALGRGATEEDAVAHALGHSGLAVAMTSLTTAGGLASFSAAALAPIASLGFAGPVGVMVSLVFTLVLVPALIRVFPVAPGGREVEPERSRTLWLLTKCGEFGTRRARFVVTVTVGLLAIATLGALTLRFSHYPVRWFPKDDPFRVATELLNDKLRGTLFLELLIDSGTEDGVRDPALLNALEELRIGASRIYHDGLFVGKSISVADVVKEIHQALNENRPEFYAVPQDRELVSQELLLFEQSGSDDLEDVVDSRFRMARFTAKMPFVDALSFAPFIEAIEEAARAALPAGVVVETTGLISLLGRTFEGALHTLIRSYLIAFCVIAPLLVMLLGSLRIGLIAMIPNFAPILLTLGVMGWLGVPLELFTLLIGSIALGLAVDDTIHFMHNFRRYHERSGDVEDAVRQTLQTTGQALLFTSVVLSTGFFIYMLSSLNNLFTFGWLTGFTILSAFLADVILAPALMALFVGGGSGRAAAGAGGGAPQSAADPAAAAAAARRMLG